MAEWQDGRVGIEIPTTVDGADAARIADFLKSIPGMHQVFALS